MGKKKVIPKWEKVYHKYDYADTYPLSVLCADEEEVTIEIKRRLNVGEVINLVDTVCYSVLSGEKNTYRPELRDYFMRLSVLQAYTNIDIPENLEEGWRLAYGTPYFAAITGDGCEPVLFNGTEYDDTHIDMDQYRGIVRAIDAKIQYTLAERAKPTTFSNILDNIQPMLESFFSGIDGVDIKAFINKMNALDKLDTKSLVDTYFDHLSVKDAGKDEDGKGKVIEMPAQNLPKKTTKRSSTTTKKTAATTAKKKEEEA